MTTPFWCLLVGCLLPYILTGVGAALRKGALGSLDNKHPRLQATRLEEGAAARALHAQANAWEALPVFASGVVVAHLASADVQTSAYLAMGWVAARVVHGIVYLANLDMVRSLAFTVGLGCAIGLFVVSM